MNLLELKTQLNEHGDKFVVFQFADGRTLEPHFHVTEIGKLTKSFMDCGGTYRSAESCVLQTYVANDVDHRIQATLLLRIFEHARELALDARLPVEIEVQMESVAIYRLSGYSVCNDTLTLNMTPKQTTCLAPETCGIEVVPLNPLGPSRPE